MPTMISFKRFLFYTFQPEAQSRTCHILELCERQMQAMFQIKITVTSVGES